MTDNDILFLKNSIRHNEICTPEHQAKLAHLGMVITYKNMDGCSPRPTQTVSDVHKFLDEVLRLRHTGTEK